MTAFSRETLYISFLKLFVRKTEEIVFFNGVSRGSHSINAFSLRKFG